MSRASCLMKYSKSLALALCMPLSLTLPHIATAGDATRPATDIASASNERSIALPPEHGASHQSTALTVFFAFDSTELTTPSRRALDTVAPTLRAHLRAGGRVLIEGHADDVGTASYNVGLSERRANSIAAYLRDAWEIPVQRLTLRGWGASDLRRTDAPHHAENRRVEVTLLEPRTTRTRGLAVRPRAGGHLDIDDFGGAMSPLPIGNQITTAPAPIRKHR